MDTISLVQYLMTFQIEEQKKVERRTAIDKYNKKRRKKLKRYMKMNAHGRPVMTGLVHNLLDKIKESKESGKI